LATGYASGNWPIEAFAFESDNCASSDSTQFFWQLTLRHFDLNLASGSLALRHSTFASYFDFSVDQGPWIIVQQLDFRPFNPGSCALGSWTLKPI
jgi:hypothetical protein